MKCMLKIARFSVKPLKRRGFSRVDLVILLLLGVVVTIDLLLHAFQPAGTVRASQLVQVQAQSTNRQVDTSSSSLMPTSPQTSSTQQVSTSSRQSSATAADSCTTPPSFSSYTFPHGNISGPFGNHDFLFFFTDRQITVDECHIQAISNVMAFVVNMFVVILFLLAGLRLMLSGSVIRYASAIEVLPGILLALLAANLCLPIVGLSLDLNNSLTDFSYSTLNGMPVSTVTFNGKDVVTQTCNNWWTAAGAGAGLLSGVPGAPIVLGILGAGIGCNVDPHVKHWQETLQKVAQAPNITGGASITGFMFAFQSMTDLLQFVVGIMALMLMGQMAIRLLLINLYIATGPLGMGAWALPGNGGKQLTRLWLQGFFTTLFVQFLQVIALIIVRLLIGVITSALYASLNGPNANYVNSDATLLWVMQIAQYWFILRIPSLLRLGPSSPMNMITGFGQTMAQTAQTVVGITMVELQFAYSAATSAISAGAALIR